MIRLRAYHDTVLLLEDEHTAHRSFVGVYGMSSANLIFTKRALLPEQGGRDRLLNLVVIQTLCFWKPISSREQRRSARRCLNLRLEVRLGEGLLIRATCH